MSERIIVRPDKNEFLLFTMLNVLGLAADNKFDSHPLRKRAVEHFKDYQGLGLKEEDYLHYYKAVVHALTLNQAPDFSKKSLILNPESQNDARIDNTVLPHLKHFYHNTNFEDFYQKILPEYQEISDHLQRGFDRFSLTSLLKRAWEIDTPLNIEVIPMPLEAQFSGTGP